MESNKNQKRNKKGNKKGIEKEMDYVMSDAMELFLESKNIFANFFPSIQNKKVHIYGKTIFSNIIK